MQSEVLDISLITADTIGNGEYIKTLPEFYAQRGIIENGIWHKNQDVFDHAVKVFKALERILKFEHLSHTQKAILEKYLSEIVGNVSRNCVLQIATLIHDIGKVDTLIKKIDGTASTPGHELISAGRVNRFSDRFGLNIIDEKYVERIVRYHRLIAEILMLISANGDRQRYLNIFQETVSDVSIELILFMQADLEGSDLEQNDKSLYDSWLNTLEWMLNTLIITL